MDECNWWELWPKPVLGRRSPQTIFEAFSFLLVKSLFSHVSNDLPPEPFCYSPAQALPGGCCPYDIPTCVGCIAQSANRAASTAWGCGVLGEHASVYLNMYFVYIHIYICISMYFLIYGTSSGLLLEISFYAKSIANSVISINLFFFFLYDFCLPFFFFSKQDLRKEASTVSRWLPWQWMGQAPPRTGTRQKHPRMISMVNASLLKAVVSQNLLAEGNHCSCHPSRG